MIVESVELKNFRNYRELKLLFDEKTNIFYGEVGGQAVLGRQTK